MRAPFRLQVFALLLAAIGTTLVGWGTLQTWLSQRRDRRQIEERLVRTVGLLERDRFPLDDGTAQRIRDLSGFEIAVHDETGDLAAVSDAALGDLPPREAGDELALEAAGEANARGQDWFRWTRTLDRRRLGGGILKIDLLYPVATWNAARSESFWTAWSTAGVFLPLGFAAAWFFARRVTSPLSRLRDRLDQLAEGDYASVGRSDRADEIGDVLRAAETLGERLREYESKVRRQERLAAIGALGAGVAHQMRNALTGALLGIDLHRRASSAATGAGSAARPEDDEPLDVARRQLAGMEAYLRRFLDAAKGTPQRQRVDLRDLLARVRASLAPAAAHRGIALSLDGGEAPLFVEGDPAELEQMLLNVATNALEAAGEREAADASPRVELFGGLDQGAPTLRIVDNGPEPVSPLNGAIYEPLVTTKPDGAGLGLTVARRVAEDHGASIEAVRRDGLTTFAIRFATNAGATEDR